MSKASLTAARLRELLKYDPETGVFTWVARIKGIKPGSTAGCQRKDGYIVLRVDRSLHPAHRLAWLYVHGEHPKADIDHIDGNPSNNAISNLRDVSRSINNQNQRRPHSKNKSGHLGVSREKGGKLWEARIKGPDGVVRRGHFATPELAHAAYLEAKRALHAGCTI